MLFKELHIVEPNNWVNIRKLASEEYECTCNCGNIEIISTECLMYNKTRACKICTKHDNSERQRRHLEGSRFGLWEIHEYLGKQHYNCLCTGCNRIFKVDSRDLVQGKSKSCKECSGLSLEDITDKKFGNYRVIRYIGNHYWECECLKCGKYRNVTVSQLKYGRVTQCKECYMKEKIETQRIKMYKDWSSKDLGELTPVEYMNDIDSWKCQCSCGNTVVISRTNLRSGATRSCGCKTAKFKKRTMLHKYGEIASKKITNPRSLEQIEQLENKDKFIEVYNQLSSKINRKPTSKELGDKLGVQINTLLRYAHAYNIELYDGRSSQQELEFARIFSNAKTHDRSVLNGHELDFLFENAKLAIEMNGDLWHSDAYKDKYYHQNKTIECAKKHIRLIHIFEHEWLDYRKQNILISMINQLVNNKYKLKIGARKTYIKEINRDIAKDFLDKYHLQEYAESKIKIGCFYKEELIGVMTFGKPRFNNNYQYELVRLCWKPGYIISGGTEKIFKHCVNEYGIKSVITYVDISKFTGNSYTKLGFHPIQPKPITEPNYVWISSNLHNIYSRYDTQKHKLIKQGLDRYGSTEDEIMKNLNYFKIYNSGNLKLEWKEKEM